MSFIRSTSNPEGVYVYGGTDGVVICSGRDWHLSNVGPDQSAMVVPYKVFYKACRNSDWVVENYPVVVDGFRVEEIHIYSSTGRKVPPRSLGTMIRSKADTMFAIRLSYEEHYVFMHRVTWDYIRRNALANEAWSKERKREDQQKKAKSAKKKVRA